MEVVKMQGIMREQLSPEIREIWRLQLEQFCVGGKREWRAMRNDGTQGQGLPLKMVALT